MRVNSENIRKINLFEELNQGMGVSGYSITSNSSPGDFARRYIVNFWEYEYFGESSSSRSVIGMMHHVRKKCIHYFGGVIIRGNTIFAVPSPPLIEVMLYTMSTQHYPIRALRSRSTHLQRPRHREPAQ